MKYKILLIYVEKTSFLLVETKAESARRPKNTTEEEKKDLLVGKNGGC